MGKLVSHMFGVPMRVTDGMMKESSEGTAGTLHWHNQASTGLQQGG